MSFMIYDELLPEQKERSARIAHVALFVLPLLFAILGIAAILFLVPDNMKGSGPATSALPAAASIAQDFSSWFEKGFWYAENTPAPLYYTAIAIIFRVFGYAPLYARAATCLLSAVAIWAIGAVVGRRFGLLGGLLAQALFILNPLMMFVSLSSGYYIWGLAPIFIGIDLLDRHHLSQRKRYYFAAALAFLCSGMCRPEHFVLTLAPILLVSVPLFCRIAFCGITWSYPLACALYTFAHGLRVPNSEVTRVSETLGTIFIKWEQLSWRLMIGNLQGTHWVLLAMAMLTVGFFTRTRFLSVISVLLWPFFCALDLTSAGEPYMAHHYYMVSAFLLVFAAGALTVMTKATVRLASRYCSAKGMRVVYAMIAVSIVLTFTPIGRARSLGTVLSSQIRPESRVARDFLRKTAEPSDGIVVDCSPDITWLMAELCTQKNALWAYSSAHQGRPFSDPREDDASIRIYNEFMASAVKPWVSVVRPSWLITPSEQDWAKHARNLNYRSISLRPVLGRKAFYDGCKIPLDLFTIRLGLEFENSAYSVYRLTYQDLPQLLANASPNLLCNGGFKEWQGDRLIGWDVLFNARTRRLIPKTGEEATELAGASPGQPAALTQVLPYPASLSGRRVFVQFCAWGSDPGKLEVNLSYWVNGKCETAKVSHPGGKRWCDLDANFVIPESIDSIPPTLCIINQADASFSARLRSVSVRVEQ